LIASIRVSTGVRLFFKFIIGLYGAGTLPFGDNVSPLICSEHSSTFAFNFTALDLRVSQLLVASFTQDVPLIHLLRHSDGGTVTATATLFAARYCAASRGGSIYAVNQAVVTLSMVAFGRQDASKGSGVYLDTSTLSITNSTFLKVRSTQAPHGGAGVFAAGSHVRLERVVFDHCGRDGEGDASDTNSVIQFSAKDGSLCKQPKDGNPYFCHQTGDPDVNLAIIGTAFEPFDKASTVVMNTSWLETVGGCSEHPCPKGHVSAGNTVGCLSAAPFAVEV